MFSRSSNDMYGINFFDCFSFFFENNGRFKVTWPNLHTFTLNCIIFQTDFSLFCSSFVAIGLNRQDIDHTSTFEGNWKKTHALIGLVFVNIDLQIKDFSFILSQNLLLDNAYKIMIISAKFCVEIPQVHAVHRFKWDSSCCESCRHCADLWTLQLTNAFCG